MKKLLLLLLLPLMFACSSDDEEINYIDNGNYELKLLLTNQNLRQGEEYHVQISLIDKRTEKVKKIDNIQSLVINSKIELIKSIKEDEYGNVNATIKPTKIGFTPFNVSYKGLSSNSYNVNVFSNKTIDYPMLANDLTSLYGNLTLKILDITMKDAKKITTEGSILIDKNNSRYQTKRRYLYDGYTYIYTH